MKTFQNKVILNSNKLLSIQSKNFQKSVRPTYYNLRLFFSNLRRNDHGYQKWDTIYGPEGHEKVNNIDKLIKKILKN
jgi:hypothetical protein